MIELLIAAALASPASETWTCVQPSWPDKKPITLVYRLEGARLVEVDFGLTFTVVHNDARAIVATYPSIDRDLNGKPMFDARTIVINRLTGEMIVSNIDLYGSEAENVATRGSCGKKLIP